MATNTSITVSFVTPDDEVDDDGNIVQSISAEFDNAPDRNDGRTQFLFGSTAYFKTFRVPANLQIELIESAGTLNTFLYSGSDQIVGEQIQFSMSDNASPSKPISGGFSYVWHGRSPAPVATVSTNGSQINLNRPSLGFLVCDFFSNFNGHSITLAQQEISPFPVLIYIRAVE